MPIVRKRTLLNDTIIEFYLLGPEKVVEKYLQCPTCSAGPEFIKYGGNGNGNGNYYKLNFDT